MPAVAPILATLALLGAPTTMSMTHPPRVFTSWVVVSAIAVLAVAMALWSSSRTSRRTMRRLQAAALIVALFSLSFPLMSYFKSYNDFPWLSLAPFLLLLIVSGWKFNQKWLSAGCIAIVAFFVITARAAPAHGLPKSLTADDVTVTVEKVAFCNLTVRSAPGTRVEDELDLRNIQVEGKVCRVLPVTCWRPRTKFYLEDELLSNEAVLSAYTFPPGWSRTMDLSVRLLKWPPEAATSVTVPVPRPGDKIDTSTYDSDGGGIQLSVSRVRWSQSRTSNSDEPVLAMTISYEGYSYSGWRGTELRVRDENGRTVRLSASGVSGSAAATYVQCEISVAHGATEFSVDAYTEEQREQASVYLRFGRLPIG